MVPLVLPLSFYLSSSSISSFRFSLPLSSDGSVRLVRYIYVPLGGSRQGMLRRVANVFIVFSAVIFFHAPQIFLEPHYLVWGYGNLPFHLFPLFFFLFLSVLSPLCSSSHPIFAAMALFIAPEILASKIVDQIGGGSLRVSPLASCVNPISALIVSVQNKWYYRHLQSIGGAFNIFVLILANLLVRHFFSSSFFLFP